MPTTKKPRFGTAEKKTPPPSTWHRHPKSTSGSPKQGNGWSGTFGIDHYFFFFFFFFYKILCFTSYFVFSIAVLPHSPGVVYYHLLLRRETRNPGVAPFFFRIGIWDLFVHRGQKPYTPTAFGKLWTTTGVGCMKHASS